MERGKAENTYAKTSGYVGYKPCSPVEGREERKMTEQKHEMCHKICHPELGCSGDLNLSDKDVHTLNVGDLHSGRGATGLTATDVECKSRNSHSSRSKGKLCTGRRTVVSQKLPDKVEGIPRKQRELAQLGKQEERIGNLYEVICNKEWIKQAMVNVLGNVGAKTAGVDGIVKQDYYRPNDGFTTIGLCEIETLSRELTRLEYKPQPVRRIYIPKANGKERPLGIPTLRDRVIQECVRMILEPIYESKFLDCSFGFRPNRSTKDAITGCYQRISPSNKYYWVIEGDIKSCFDRIDHRILMRLLRKVIADRKFTSLIRKFLRAGYIEDGVIRKPEKGTPQGGIVSPLLANVYLHELDVWWLDKYYGESRYPRTKRREKGLGNFLLTRYADDFIILSNATKKNTETMKERLTVFLRDELELELSREKTKLTHVSEGFDFLGFHVRLFKNRTGVMITPTKKNIQRMRDKIASILHRKRYTVAVREVIMVLNPIVRGWSNYYRSVNASKAFNDLSFYLKSKFIKWYRGRHRLTSVRKGTRMALRWIYGDESIHLRLFSDTKIRTNAFRRGSTNKPPENPYIVMGSEIIRDDPNPNKRMTWYGTSPTRSAELRANCLRRDKNICQICKNHRYERELIAHHKIPLKEGGLDELENLRTICKDCAKEHNRSLHYMNMSWEVFMQKIEMTNGEPCARKLASTVRRGGAGKHA